MRWRFGIHLNSNGIILSKLYITLSWFILIFFNLFIYFHSQDIQEAHAGQIVAVFGVDCASGNTPPFYINKLKHNICLFSVDFLIVRGHTGCISY